MARHEKFLQDEGFYQGEPTEGAQLPAAALQAQGCAAANVREVLQREEVSSSMLLSPEIFDYSVFEYAFAFWQWGEDIKKIPTRDATDRPGV